MPAWAAPECVPIQHAVPEPYCDPGTMPAGMSGPFSGGVGQFGTAAFSPDSSLAIRLLQSDSSSRSVVSVPSGGVVAGHAPSQNAPPPLLQLLTTLQHIWDSPLAESGSATTMAPAPTPAPTLQGGEASESDDDRMDSVVRVTLAELGFMDD